MGSFQLNFSADHELPLSGQFAATLDSRQYLSIFRPERDQVWRIIDSDGHEIILQQVKTKLHRIQRDIKAKLGTLATLMDLRTAVLDNERKVRPRFLSTILKYTVPPFNSNDPRGKIHGALGVVN